MDPLDISEARLKPCSMDDSQHRHQKPVEASIASYVNRCLGLFHGLTGSTAGKVILTTDPSFARSISDQKTRFKIWAGNIGAHKTGMSSLEYRLRDSSPIRRQVMEALGDLKENLNDALEIICEVKQPWDRVDDGVGPEEEKDSETELDQVSMDVADIIDGLLRLSNTIRNPAPHYRFRQSRFTDTSHYEPFDIQHVLSKFESIDKKLAERLGKAISRRRQYFRYRQSHNAKLSHGLEGEGGDTEHTVASSLPEHLKQQAGQPASRVAKPPLEDDHSDAGFSQTSYATTTACEGQRRIPPLPEEAYNGPFECPFCYMIIIVDNQESWKKHVYGDLRPYICLEENCDTPEKEFSRRHHWMEHLRQQHWKVYKCPLACGFTTNSLPEAEVHIIQFHADAIVPSEVSALVRLSTESIEFKTGALCPFCGEAVESASKYQQHVGRHQEQVALFALPDTETTNESEHHDDTASESHIDGDANEFRDEGSAGVPIYYPMGDQSSKERDGPSPEPSREDFDGVPSSSRPLSPAISGRTISSSSACPYCSFKGKRRADLNRHISHCHRPSTRPRFYRCDYRPCTRRDEPFSRRDHFRYHLRDYHKEDIEKPGVVVDDTWYSDRNTKPGWWRCSKCLIRVSVEERGWECPSCGGKCSTKRQEVRMAWASK